MGGKKASKAAANEAAQARRDEEERQFRIKNGTDTINRIFYGDGQNGGQFNDAFFNGIANSYNDFALPQLQEQHTKAGDELIYDLARTGNLDSSTRATKGADLQKAYDLNKQSIADKALGLKNDTKNAVEDARYNVISQLNATGDADGAANAAMTRASALSQPAMDFSPLSGLFADFTSGLGNAYAQERAYAASGGASHGGGASYGNAATGRKGTVTVRS